MASPEAKMTKPIDQLLEEARKMIRDNSWSPEKDLLEEFVKYLERAAAEPRVPSPINRLHVGPYQGLTMATDAGSVLVDNHSPYMIEAIAWRAENRETPHE